MENRGYNVSKEWFDKNYRGKVCNPHKNLKDVKIKSPIYKEHNKDYYQECIENLAQKDIRLISMIEIIFKKNYFYFFVKIKILTERRNRSNM